MRTYAKIYVVRKFCDFFVRAIRYHFVKVVLRTCSHARWSYSTCRTLTSMGVLVKMRVWFVSFFKF